MNTKYGLQNGVQTPKAFAYHTVSIQCTLVENPSKDRV